MDTSPVSADMLPLQRLFHWERSIPDQVYLSQPMGAGVMRDFTWRQTVDEARRLATWLRSFDWEPGSRIAILSKNCAWWLITDYAIWMAGHVSVPLYPTITAAAVRQILEHSGSRACLVGKLDDWDRMMGGVPPEVTCFGCPLSPPGSFVAWDEVMRTNPPLADEPTRAANDLATIVYTSGTTGQPKGVMHSFGTLAWASAAASARFPSNAGDRALSYLPLSHIAERLLVELGSLNGTARIYFPESLATFMADLQRARPTRFFSVPRLWLKFQQGVLAKMPQPKLDRMLRLPFVSSIVRRKILTGLGLDRCRLAAGGAAPMPPELLTWYARLGLEIIEAYGMTENAAVSHSTLPGRPRAGYVGLPYPGVECRIDPVTGELQMRSPALMLGYYREPELTRDAIAEDGWLRTGDQVELAPDGQLRITGRVKDLFKTSKGQYVVPAPIECKLAMLPGVEACCVAGASFGRPFGLLTLSLEVLQRTADSEAARATMSTALQGHLTRINGTLEPHERLEFLVVLQDQWTVDNGMVTPTLKFRRDRVESAYRDRFEDWVAQQKPVVWQAAAQTDRPQAETA